MLPHLLNNGSENSGRGLGGSAEMIQNDTVFNRFGAVFDRLGAVFDRLGAENGAKTIVNSAETKHLN